MFLMLGEDCTVQHRGCRMAHMVLPSPWAPHGLGCGATPMETPPVHPGPSVPMAGTQHADLPQAGC